MRRALVAVGMWLAVAAPAAAQQTPYDVLSFLITNQSVPTGDFQKDAAAAAATRDTIARELLVNLVTAPIATSSSGFVYRLDPELGTMTRVSDTFGAFFVERASTSGRGRFTLGASGTTASYDRLDGMDLTSGTLVTTANQLAGEPGPFDTESLTLKVRTSTMTIFANYGLSDRLEIGGAVPLVQLHLEGSRVNVYRGQTFVQATGQADASGLADAAVRMKYAVLSGPSGGIAAAAELRLPTGNTASLLGAGRAALRLMAIASAERHGLGLHGNVAVVAGGVSSEFDANGAVTVAVTPRVTAVGELLLRRLSDLHPIIAESDPHPTIPNVTTLRLVPDVTRVPFVGTAVTGVKWNARGRLVISGDVQWRLTSNGLTAPFTPTISFDYLF